MYVKQVSGNVKGKSNADNLGPRTLIVGPNGAGKSAIINGIELALSGRASDVVGRAEVARGIDLLALAPHADDALWATVVLSDDSEVGWKCEKNLKTGGAREPTFTGRGVPVTFPVREIRAALEGKPETARAFLLGRMGDSVSHATVAATLPPDLAATYAALAKPMEGSPVAILLLVREAAAKQSRAATAEATLATKMADERAAGLGIEPSEDDVIALGTAANTAQSMALGARRGVDPLVIGHARKTAEALVLTVTRLETQRQPVLDPKLSAWCGELSKWLLLHVENNADSCVVCGAGLSSGHLSAMRARIDALRVSVAAASLEGEYVRALDAATVAVTRYRDLAAQGEATGEGESQASLDAAVATAGRAWQRAIETRAAWLSVRDARSRARDAEARSRVGRDLAAACEASTADLLAAARSTFASRVQSYLPDSDRFDLVLTDAGKDVCRFGFVREGHLHTALSGAEWARLTLALAAAVTDDAEDRVSILTPEERAFDPDTLRAVLIGLKNAPGQVILTSPVRPAGKTPAGWTLIDLTPEAAPRVARKLALVGDGEDSFKNL